jgi:hypothetical protein
MMKRDEKEARSIGLISADEGNTSRYGLAPQSSYQFYCDVHIIPVPWFISACPRVPPASSSRVRDPIMAIDSQFYHASCYFHYPL